MGRYLDTALRIGLLGLGVLAGCGGDSNMEDPDPPGPVSFARDIQPVFNRKCIACHHPESAIDVDLTKPFDPDHGIIGRANTWVPNGSQETLIVDPGNIDNSFLVKKVEEESLDDHVDGVPMPMHVARLTADEVSAIKQWIADGAQNDAFFAENVAPIFGTQITLRSTAGKCTWCHYPGAPNGLSVLDPFDPEEGMVGRTGVYGRVIVAPGDVEGSFLVDKIEQLQPEFGTAMPFQPPRLTEEEQALVRAWIEQGAQNN